jgi:Zn-dependent peptidase ImmA (M78 family)
MNRVSFTFGYVNSCFKEGEPMTNITVEKKAREILEKYGLEESVPVDPIKIANANGIEVKNAIFKSEDICGILHKKDGKTTIYVNQKDSGNRKRFSIAHELGHYFLHHENDNNAFIVELRTNNNNGGQDLQKEKEANAFAAALLMDEVLVRSVWHDLRSIQAAAEIFDVSYESMSYRLNNLGLLAVS